MAAPAPIIGYHTAPPPDSEWNDTERYYLRRQRELGARYGYINPVAETLRTWVAQVELHRARVVRKFRAMTTRR